MRPRISRDRRLMPIGPNTSGTSRAVIGKSATRTRSCVKQRHSVPGCACLCSIILAPPTITLSRRTRRRPHRPAGAGCRQTKESVSSPNRDWTLTTLDAEYLLRILMSLMSGGFQYHESAPAANGVLVHVDLSFVTCVEVVSHVYVDIVSSVIFLHEGRIACGRGHLSNFPADRVMRMYSEPSPYICAIIHVSCFCMEAGK